MVLREILILLCLIVPASFVRGEQGHPTSPLSAKWIYFDAIVWDLADEGLPFILTFAVGNQRGPLARLLHATENRWTISAGYARVYNSYDQTTGTFKNEGGDALLISGARQWFWDIASSAWVPRISIEFGVNIASRPFPADGTEANLKLHTGLEWQSREGPGRARWSGGIYWPHFSNANLLSRNAGYDGLMIRVGRRCQF